MRRTGSEHETRPLRHHPRVVLEPFRALNAEGARIANYTAHDDRILVPVHTTKGPAQNLVLDARAISLVERIADKGRDLPIGLGMS